MTGKSDDTLIETLDREEGAAQPQATPIRVATRLLQQHCAAARAVKRWPVGSPAVRRELVLHGICPDCGADAPRGSVSGSEGTKALPMHCHACGFREERK